MEQFLILIVLVVLFGIAVIYVKKSGVLLKNFDERQERARGKAYQLAFYSGLIWSTLLYFLALEQEPKVSIHFCYGSTAFVGTATVVVYTIWTDAYFNWQDRNRYLSSSLYAFLMTAVSWRQLLSDKTWIGSDWFSYIIEKDGAIFFFRTLFFGLLLLVFLAKWLWEKKEASRLNHDSDEE